MNDLLQLIYNEINLSILELVTGETQMQLFVSFLYKGFKSANKTISFSIVESIIDAQSFQILKTGDTFSQLNNSFITNIVFVKVDTQGF